MSLLEQIQTLDLLLFPPGKLSLVHCSLEEKNKRLTTAESLSYLHHSPWLKKIYAASDSVEQLLLLTLFHTGQASALLFDPDLLLEGWGKWKFLFEKLQEVELFYEPIGGLLGYHREVLLRLAHHLGVRLSNSIRHSYEQPPRLDIRLDDSFVKELTATALEQWEKIALVMPVGGAGERLGLGEERGQLLPAAFLSFEGKTLLEGLVDDIGAIEELIYQTKGRRIYTPIAMMTSDEKGNHLLIEQFFEEHSYFGRPKESIRLFRQKMVPVVTEKGKWLLRGPLDLVFKPDGHGAIWRSCELSGILDWLEAEGKTHALVRQVNNPMAATDANFLALAGYGLAHNVALVLLSCERLVSSSEGVNVLRLRHTEGAVQRSITNVEYTNFSQEGIQESAEEPDSLYSAFSSNTNIFLIELQAMRRAIKKDPFPGAIINLKTRVLMEQGAQKEMVKTGRLESMMQNIADAIESAHELPLAQALLFGERSKVISVAKKKQPIDSGFTLETPFSAFYDRQKMFRNLLVRHCSMHLPLLPSAAECFEKRLPFLLYLDPRLGPLHSLIEQRIQGGTISSLSVLELRLQHLLCEELYLEGALRVESSRLSEGYLWLNRVSIVNSGWKGLGEAKKETEEKIFEKSAWKAPFQQSCRIHLEGRSGFVADHIRLEGNLEWRVPDGALFIASAGKNGEISVEERAFDPLFIEALGFKKIYSDWIATLRP